MSEYSWDEDKDKDSERVAARGDEIMEKLSKTVGSGVTSKGWTTKEDLKNKLGICCDCSRLDFTRTEFGRVLAECHKKKMRLVGKDRVVECTSYWQRGQMDLFEMYNMATIIEVNKITIKGFTDK